MIKTMGDLTLKVKSLNYVAAPLIGDADNQRIVDGMREFKRMDGSYRYDVLFGNVHKVVFTDEQNPQYAKELFDKVKIND